MTGGAADYTANVIPSGNSNIETYGGEIANAASTGKSNKYITLYPVGGSISAATDASRSYSAWGPMYGDCIWEVSSRAAEGTGWNGDNIDEDTTSNDSFFMRGGYWLWGEYAGLFALVDGTGRDSDHCTSRVVFTVE